MIADGAFFAIQSIISLSNKTEQLKKMYGLFRSVMQSKEALIRAKWRIPKLIVTNIILVLFLVRSTLSFANIPPIEICVWTLYSDNWPWVFIHTLYSTPREVQEKHHFRACKWVTIRGETPRDLSWWGTGHKNNILKMDDSSSFRLMNTSKIMS